jgi:1-phosphatidylinositol-3-phosphate 5-kinase
LELSFSSQSAAKRLSKCGHLLHRDCLRFFGLGSKVAVFWYTPVDVFTAFKPPSILEFNSPNRNVWLKDEYREKVLPRGSQLFSQIATILQHLKNKQEVFASASIKELGVEEMFNKEKADFENLLECIEKNEKSEDTAANELLNLNREYQDLILQTYVWDHRLRHLQYKLSCEQQEKNEKTREESTNNRESLEVSSQASLNGNKAQIETFDMNQSSLVSKSNLAAKESLTENSILEDTERWIGAPFTKLKSAYHNDISNLNLTRFFMVNNYTPVHLLLSPLNDEREQSRFSGGPDGSLL